jgi:DHHC palmitoyltransferase
MSKNINNQLDEELLCQQTVEESRTKHSTIQVQQQYIQTKDDTNTPSSSSKRVMKSETDDVETNNRINDDFTNRRPPYWMVISRYLVVYLFAVGLTISCPGNTLLWRIISDSATYDIQQQQDNETTTSDSMISIIQCIIVWILFIGTSVMAIVSYFKVQGSIPGYISLANNNPHFDNNDPISDHPSFYNNDDDKYHNNSCNTITNTGNGQNKTSISLNDNNTSIIYHRMDDNNINNRNDNTNYKRDDKDIASTLNNNNHNILVNLPLRSYCCKYCNNQCIATFDHHCFYLDTCIGECNHYVFYIFLFWQIITCIVCLICVVNTNTYIGPVQVWEQYTNNIQYSSTSSSPSNDVTNDMSASFTIQRILFAYVYLITCIILVSILFGLHTYLICTNTTTYEYMKGPSSRILPIVSNKVYPYSQGSIYKNIYQFVTIRRHPYNPLTWKPIDWNNELILEHGQQQQNNNISGNTVC